MNDDIALPDGVRITTVTPLPRRQRVEQVWDVWLHHDRIGRIEQTPTRHARGHLFRATYYHPHTAQAIALRSSSDLSDRIASIIKAWLHPDEPQLARA